MYRVFDRRRIHYNRLETAFKSRILFNILAVFVKSSRTNALEFATSKRWLENVRCIKAAFGAACAHNRVEFINKENHRIANTLEFRNEALHAFFELSAILCTRHHSGNIKRHDALVRQQIRNLALNNLLRKAFDNRRLAHARFANQRRVVLFATAKDLNQAFNFSFTTDNRVQFACTGHRREVTTEMFKNRSLGARRRSLTRLRITFTRIVVRLAIIHRLPFGLMLDLHQHVLIILERDIVRRKSRCRRRVRLLQNGKHQMFRANELHALFFCNLCRIVKHGLALRRKREETAVGVAANCHETTARAERTLNRFAEFRQIDFQSLQRFRSHPGIFADKPKQQMFYRDTIAA